MAQTPLAEQTPVEIDTQIAEIQQRAIRPEQKRNVALRTIEAFENPGENARGYERISEWERDRAEERLVEAEAELEALRAEVSPFYSEFERRGRWPRYFHVTNTNGHVHTSTHCTSCFIDTQYSWRTDLSGLTPEEVVERESHWACSVCMPIAPADQKAAFKAYQEQKRADKKAEREAKAAEKAARKLAREESLAWKANAALNKYGKGEPIKQAWYDGKITDSVYDTLYDAGQADRKKY